MVIIWCLLLAPALKCHPLDFNGWSVGTYVCQSKRGRERGGGREREKKRERGEERGGEMGKEAERGGERERSREWSVDEKGTKREREEEKDIEITYTVGFRSKKEIERGKGKKKR